MLLNLADYEYMRLPKQRMPRDGDAGVAVLFEQINLIASYEAMYDPDKLSLKITFSRRHFNGYDLYRLLNKSNLKSIVFYAIDGREMFRFFIEDFREVDKSRWEFEFKVKPNEYGRAILGILNSIGLRYRV